MFFRQSLRILWRHLGVALVVSQTGLISFTGLLAPHCAGRLVKNNGRLTFLMSGIMGGIILVFAYIPQKSGLGISLSVLDVMLMGY